MNEIPKLCDTALVVMVVVVSSNTNAMYATAGGSIFVSEKCLFLLTLLEDYSFVKET